MKHQWLYVTLESTWDATEHNQGGFRIAWGCEIGFGLLGFYLDNDRVLRCDSELMDDEFSLEVLTEFYRRAEKQL